MEQVRYNVALSLSLLVHSLLAVNAIAQPNVARPAGQPLLPLPPAPPLAESPVNYFRTLLASSPPERTNLLASKPPDQRQALESKLREYESLSPVERDFRLRTLDLRWFVKRLMPMAPSNRLEVLAGIPRADRILVEERLRQWDQWPPELRNELLENEMAIRMLTGTDMNPGRPAPAGQVSAKQREQKEQSLNKYLKLPEPKRQEIYQRFREIFELSPEEKMKTLRLLPEPERAQMEQALRLFARLSTEEREQCISGFQKLAALPPEERQEFLTNAERWEAMNVKDREAWRNLVHRVRLPPLPPGFRFPRTPPPLPPPPGASSVLLTNK